MGKIQANPADFDKGEEGSEETPAFVPEDEEELEVAQEGAKVTTEEDGVEEEKPKYVFKNDEELQAYLEKNKKTEVKPPPPPQAPPTSTPTPTKETEPDELDSLIFYKGAVDPETGKWVGEVPKDWNDFARKIVKHLSSDDYKKSVVDYIRNMSASEKKEMEKIDAEFDAEYDELSSQGLVPARNSEEGKKVNEQISVLGAKYGFDSMKKAYDVWANIPVEKGGGLNYKPSVRKVNPSKEASRLVGGNSTQTAPRAKSKIPYSKLHSRNIDELLDE